MQEVHGGELPPAEGCDAGNPDWIEAGRWLERQRDLYRRQKLLLLRVRLMKELLGEGRGAGAGLGAAGRADGRARHAPEMRAVAAAGVP